jgi:hypothetical protein
MKNRLCCVMVFTAAVLLLSGCGTTGSSGSADRPWTAEDQPGLAEALEDAASLPVEKLGKGPVDVFDYEAFTAPNSDGESWDVLKWYFEDYNGPTWLFAIDLGTGTVVKQEFPRSRQLHLCGRTLGYDGHLYITTPYPHYGMELYEYDPDTNTLIQHGVIIPGLGGERRPLETAPDGIIFGAGSRNDGRAGVFSYDPDSRTVKDYGAVGPARNGREVWSYWGGVDETHFYLAVGKDPWSLVAMNRETGEAEVLAEAATGDYSSRMRIWNMDNGALAMVQKDDESEKKYYWLYNGTMTERETDLDDPPWEDVESPFEHFDAENPHPELYLGQTYPDGDGNAVLWWRSREDSEQYAHISRIDEDEDPADYGWDSITYGPVETYPLDIHRLIDIGDGKLFGTASGRIGRFIFDIRTGTSTYLGNGGSSIYDLAYSEGLLYWTGYPGAPLEVFDPSEPWTLDKGQPPGRKEFPISSEQTNPHRITDYNNVTRVKKMMDMAVGADGIIYLGGIGMRDYYGGGFAWYKPSTGLTGGYWKPFSGYRIYWMTTALDGRYLILSTKRSEDVLNDNKQPEEARLFVFDTEERKFVLDFVPVPRGEGEEAFADVTGPVLDAGNGRLLGLTRNPDNPDQAVLYGVHYLTGETAFRKILPAPAHIDWVHGTEQTWDFVMGPDGKIYSYLGNKRVIRIDPETAHVEVVGKIRRKTGKMTFVGNDMYLAGDDDVRVIRDIVSIEP